MIIMGRSLVVIALTLFCAQNAGAQDAGDTTNPKLIDALSKTRVTIAAALSAVKAPAVPLSAKVELGDRDQPVLSVYTANRGVASSDRRDLSELKGDPLADTWSPVSDRLRTSADIAEAQAERRLIAKTKMSLAQIAKLAKADQPGIVFSIAPETNAGKAEFVVLVLGPNRQIATLVYDLKAGSLR